MQLPIYCIIGMRPVKAVRSEDGGMRILAYNWATGEFDIHSEYLTRILFGEVDIVSAEEFEKYVEKLKQKGN